jgi:hypothetical protein
VLRSVVEFLHRQYLQVPGLNVKHIVLGSIRFVMAQKT